MRHLGVPSALTTGSPGLVMDAVNAVYQKICWAMLPWPGTGPASEKVMPAASGGAYLGHPLDVLGRSEDRGRTVGGAAALDAGPGGVAAFDPDAPLVHRLAVGNSLVTGAWP